MDAAAASGLRRRKGVCPPGTQGGRSRRRQGGRSRRGGKRQRGSRPHPRHRRSKRNLVEPSRSHSLGKCIFLDTHQQINQSRPHQRRTGQRADRYFRTAIETLLRHTQVCTSRSRWRRRRGGRGRRRREPLGRCLREGSVTLPTVSRGGARDHPSTLALVVR